jgi:hypothetical protein
MHEYRHKCWSLIKLPLLISVLAIGLSRCKVYTINKSDLETKLRPKENCRHAKGLNSLTTMYKKQYINSMDTLTCLDAVGKLKIKRLHSDSKITIITHKNKAIKFYAKTLYIWNGEFLIGERTSLNLYGPNYFPIKLTDISRIEIKKSWL